MNSQVAAHTAIWTYSVGRGLARFVPGTGLAHVVFHLEHQGPGWAHANAVAAIDAS